MSPFVRMIREARSVRQDYRIYIDGGNNPPQFTAVETENITSEGEAVIVTATAADPDNGALFYWATNLPPGASFAARNGVLSWTPAPAGAAGVYEDIRIYASDGLLDAFVITSIVVLPSNRPPEMQFADTYSVIQGETIRFTIPASDADGDTVVFSGPVLPGNATLDPTTGIINWTPGFEQSGDFQFRVSAFDGLETTTDTFEVTVLNANAAPQFDRLDRFEVFEGQTVYLRALAVDPDNPGYEPQYRLSNDELTPAEETEATVTYRAEGLPTNATLDAVTGEFIWTPGFSDAGLYRVSLFATDDGDGTDQPAESQTELEILVRNLNGAPTIAPIDSITLVRGESKVVAVTAVDGDGDAITIDLISNAGRRLPSFAQFQDNHDGTATLTITPGPNDRGDYALTVVAKDNGNGSPNGILTTSQSFVVSIESPNEVPVLNPIGDKVAVVGQDLSFTIRTSDLDEDPLTYAAENLPPGAMLIESPAYGLATVSWLPTASDVGRYTTSFTVTDSGNGDSGDRLSDSESIEFVVRASNEAALMLPIGNKSATELQELSFFIDATDPDGDRLTYSGINLPAGMVLDATTGNIRWTPNIFQAGRYDDILLMASDGNLSSTETISIDVSNSNQPPVLVPLTAQFIQEDELLSFAVLASDLDGDAITFSSPSLPVGMTLDANTGQMLWQPTFDQAGEYSVIVRASDGFAETSELEIFIDVQNRNCAPLVDVTGHAVTIGESLRFVIGANDPDQVSSLLFSAEGLPDFATLDAATGEFQWQPLPNQIGPHSVTFRVSDGISTRSKAVTLLVTTESLPPRIELRATPSFPTLPGRAITIRPLVDSASRIESSQLTIDGVAHPFDAQGRVTFRPAEPGRVLIEVTATDADGRTTTQSQVIKVRDPLDTEPPLVSFDNLDGSLVTDAIRLPVTVDDMDLDAWTLEIALQGTDDFAVLASGIDPVNSANAPSLDTLAFPNGFYSLRLAAQDVAGRRTEITADIEIYSSLKHDAARVQSDDLSVTLGGIDVSISRQYVGTDREFLGRFGYGWQMLGLETRIQSSEAPTGREHLGVFAGLRADSRLYLTLPDGQRVRFSFTPQLVTEEHTEYHLPHWTTDDNVNYELLSASVPLSRAGQRFYDLATARPYAPADPTWEQPAFTLIGPNGLRYELDGRGDTTAITDGDDHRLWVTRHGLTAADGSQIQIVYDVRDRVSQIYGPNGQVSSYRYDDRDNLVYARSDSSRPPELYGYQDAHDLTLSSTLGQTGVAFDGDSSTVGPVTDLGTLYRLQAQATPASLAAGTKHDFSFTVRDSELRGGRELLLAVEAASSTAGFTPQVPVVHHTRLVSSSTSPDHAHAVYAIDRVGLQRVTVSGTDPAVGGDYHLSISLLGDITGDRRVDALDAQQLHDLQGSVVDDGTYVVSADLNRDGRIDDFDNALLMLNYLSQINLPPVGLDQQALTHADLPIALRFSESAVDPERDELFFQLVDSLHADVQIFGAAQQLSVIPTPGYVGESTATLLVDDGYEQGGSFQFDITVSGAELEYLDAPLHSWRLQPGRSIPLLIIGKFTDQDEPALIPANYVQITSSDPAVVSVSSDGVMTAKQNGHALVSISRGPYEITQSIYVGFPESELDQALYYDGFNVAPKTLALATGNSWQLQVDYQNRVSLTSAEMGTRYLVDRADVLTVNASGLITGIGPGSATVTVVNGPESFRVPVTVTSPTLSPAIVGPVGGVIQTTGGALLQISPGAYTTEKTVSFETASAADRPYSFHSAFIPIADFQIDFGGVDLLEPAQLSFPAPCRAGGRHRDLFLHTLRRA